VGSVRRNYKRVQSGELKEYRGYEGIQRNTREYNRVVEVSSDGSQASSLGVSSQKKTTVPQIVICELLQQVV
jgi:hypothetical protein